MGDGRYYTYYQFFSIIILTFLAMFAIASMLISYYRNKERNGGKYILLTFLGIVITVIARVVECVIPSLVVANGLRYFASMAFIMVNFVLYYYLFVYMFPLYKLGASNNTNKLFEGFIGVSMLLLWILGIVSNGSTLIDSYNFFSVNYSMLYLSVLCTLLGFILVSDVNILRSKKPMYKLYDNKTISLLIVILFALPLAIYITAAIRQSVVIDFIEYFTYFALCIVINIIVYASTPYGLTSLAFDKIGDMILDYVFVIDINDNIIYKNQAASNSDFFIKSEKIDYKKIKDIYAGEIKSKQNDLGKEYIQLRKNEKEHYFAHKSRALKNEGEIIGYIITITDITELMELVYYLEDRKEKSLEANLKLQNYSKVVYHLEKEKEINALLEEIITSREKEMENLILKINDLEGKIGDDNFESYIDEAIQYNADILEDVRRTVTAYREHYGG